MKFAKAAAFVTAALTVGGCATEASRVVEVPQVAAATTASTYQGPRKPISVGKFDNRSSYLRGIFSDGTDPLGGQA